MALRSRWLSRGMANIGDQYREARSLSADMVFIACENTWLAVMPCAPGSLPTLGKG